MDGPYRIILVPNLCRSCHFHQVQRQVYETEERYLVCRQHFEQTIDQVQANLRLVYYVGLETELLINQCALRRLETNQQKEIGEEWRKFDERWSITPYRLMGPGNS
jgi:hypothetical protein